MRVLLVGSAATEGVALAGERARFDVLEAESGQDALGRLAGGGVDCLVCVEGLSDMTAVELLASVRERDESLPVLLVGDDGGLTAAGALAAGVTDYLPAGTGTELLADRIERAVAARRDSQEREREYLTLAGVAPVPMIVVGRDHTVTYANPTAGETIGDGDAEELVGESVLRFVLDGEREATIERIDGVLAEREPVETREYEFLTLDGKRRRARGTIVPVTDEGEPAALIVLDDVTNLRFHERRVEKQRHQIEQLHDIGVELAGCESPDAVYELMVEAADGILDLDLCLVGVVEEERLTLGASSTEMDTDGYIEPPIDSEEAGLSGKAYREERSYHVDDVTEFPDANPVQEYRSFIGVPIGEFGVFQAVAYEEAAFSQTELELVEILAGHVRAALIRLDQQRQLREQRDQLARENERLDEFASIVSHDLRNPLNVIEGRIDIARRESDSEHLRIAADAADRIETLIDDLLMLARQGEVVSSFEPTGIGDLVAECWETVETSEATLALETGIELSADPDRTRQLLENLFRNAVEHGGTAVTVTVGALDRKAGFFVADDGPGIPEDERDQVFDSGFSTRSEGTGFGLAIVSRIAEAHGWEIQVVESAAGGARFEISGVDLAG